MALGVIFVALNLLGDTPMVGAPLAIIAGATSMFVLMRSGLVTFISAFLVLSLLRTFPITTDLSAWYAGIGFAGLAMIAAIALYVFHTALGGRPIFGATALEE